MNLSSKILLGLCSVLSASAFAYLPSSVEVDKFVGQVMFSLEKKELKVAGELIAKHWMNSTNDEAKNFADQVVGANKFNSEKFGRQTGIEVLPSCKVGQFLYKAQAIVKYERGFVFWNFDFYNSGKGWALTSYQFNNKDFVPLKPGCS